MTTKQPRTYAVTFTIIEDAEWPYKNDGVQEVAEEVSAILIASRIKVTFADLHVTAVSQKASVGSAF